jgi:hypothetical protein
MSTVTRTEPAAGWFDAAVPPAAPVPPLEVAPEGTAAGEVDALLAHMNAHWSQRTRAYAWSVTSGLAVLRIAEQAGGDAHAAKRHQEDMTQRAHGRLAGHIGGRLAVTEVGTSWWRLARTQNPADIAAGLDDITADVDAAADQLGWEAIDPRDVLGMARLADDTRYPVQFVVLAAALVLPAADGNAA